jgi:hypothetical protein
MRGILTTSALLAAVVLVAAPGADAAMSPSYQVAGVELAAPQSNTSSFAGFANGSAGDRAFWQESIAHAPLSTCSSVGSSCLVTGGTLSLRGAGGTLTGSVTDGSVDLSTQTPGCGRQTFAVTAYVSTAAGPLLFRGTLVHYRLGFRGQCLVFAASLQGSLGTVDEGPAPAAEPVGEL